jgi:hypothetical protein
MIRGTVSPKRSKAPHSLGSATLAGGSAGPLSFIADDGKAFDHGDISGFEQGNE